MSADEPRLPRLEGAAGREPELLALLRSQLRPLWADAVLQVPVLPWTAPLEAALRDAAQGGHLVRGLEGAERALGAEARGLDMADARQESARGARVSRLLVLADDGARRFYRNVEVLLQRHAGRVLALRFEVDAARLGELLFGPGETARLALVVRKQAVAAALLALLETPSPAEPADLP